MRGFPAVRISAKEGIGIEVLLDSARERLMGSLSGEDLLLTNMRHKVLLENTLTHVTRAQDELAGSEYIELAAAELHDAIRGLEEILGERIHDQVLARIFDRFCIGK
jgi:tRNA modification GTPase